MAPRYDADLIELGWDPIALVRDWPVLVDAHAHVVDAGCGTGALLASLRGAGRTFTGFDLSPMMVAKARRRPALRGARLEVCSASERWPVEDAGADVVFALAMLEFVEHLDLALDEAARCLRPGGRALVSVETVVDWAGLPREPYELRYNEFPLWRRTSEEIELAIPPGLRVVRRERVRAYTVLERGFTCAYEVLELQREA